MSKGPANFPDFVEMAREKLQSSPDLVKGEIVSEEAVETLADQMEVEFINSQLKSKVQRLVPKQSISKIDKISSNKKDTPKKIKKPQPKAKAVKSTKTFNSSKMINFFEKDFAEKPFGRRANTTLHTIRLKPDNWISKMDHLYQLFGPDDSKYLLSLSTINFSLDQLLEAYVEVDPSSLSSVVSSVAEGRRAKGYHNWLAVAICVIISRQKSKGGSLAGRLLKLQQGLKLSNGRKRTIKTLAKHCLITYTLYRALGDFVILSPDIFEKRFLLQYPEEHVKTLVGNMKKGLPPSILTYKKFN